MSTIYFIKTMKNLIALILIVLWASGYTQEVSKKDQKEKRKVEKALEIEKLINSRIFVFKASRALPQGMPSIDLTTNPNGVIFKSDTIESYMPFFGRAYHADLNGEGGIKFKGTSKEFKLETRKRGYGYEINVKVLVPRESYQLNLFVSPGGSATLTISSNDRSSISYFGEVVQIEEPKMK